MEQDKKKILIVEDEQAISRVLKDTLELDGDYDVHIANDGQAGFVKSLDVLPDLILLDLVMPKMDGIQLLHKIRSENAWGEKVPVIVLTNLDEENSSLKDFQETKPAHFFIKSSTELEEVISTIKELLG